MGQAGGPQGLDASGIQPAPLPQQERAAELESPPFVRLPGEGTFEAPAQVAWLTNAFLAEIP